MRPQLRSLGTAIVAAVLLSPVAADAQARSDTTFELVVAATTDVHGWVRGWDYYKNAADATHGLTRAATIVDSLRSAAPNRVLLVDAGDLLQGNLLAYVAAKAPADTMSPIVAAMNAMKYDAAAIGNHEFNFGVPHLDRAVAQAKFPLLAGNVLHPDGQQPYTEAVVVQRGPVRIAIVGATTPGSMIWDRDNLAAAKLVVRDIVKELSEAIPAVRAQLKPDVVIVLLHSGLNERSSYDTVGNGMPSENVAARVAAEVPGVDLLVYGHSHKEMVDTTIGSTLLVQPRNWAASVGVAHIALARRGPAWQIVSKRADRVNVAGHAEHPDVLAATQRAHDATVRYATSPLGTTPVAWRGDSARVQDSPVTDFVNEVMRRAAKADLSATAAFTLAGLDSGDVTIAKLAGVYPYANTLRAVRISGRQLRQYLEYSARYFRGWPAPAGGGVIDRTVPGFNFDIVSGATYTIDLTKPIGSRITRLLVRGKPVQPTDSFTLALNNYRQTGGGGFAMLAGAPVVYDQQQDILQLLIDETRRAKELRPSAYATENWQIVPAEARAAAYAEMAGIERSFNTPTATTSASPVGGAPAGPTGSGIEIHKERSADVSARSPTTLRIIGTNDFHGALEPRPDNSGARRGGAAQVATAIARARSECAPECATILVSGGDLFQGTAASNFAFGRPVVALFNRDGYDASAVGNHEFDWGQDTLRARMREARFEMLAANVRYSDGRDVEWIPDDTIVMRGNLKVGIIGIATQETPTTTIARNVAGLRFDDPAPIIDDHAKSLRARGATVVIVVAHVGGFCNRDTGCSGEIFDVSRRVTQPIDAWISGHSHTLLNTKAGTVPIVQARSRGQAIEIVDIPLSAAATPAGPPRPRVVEIYSDSLAPNPGADSIVQRAVAAVAPTVNEVVGTLPVDMLKESTAQFALGNFIADAQRWAGKADVAVTNNGGIRAGLRAGPLTYGTLFEVQPFGNVLYKLTVTGRDLRSYLEQLVDRKEPNMHVSGVVVQFDPNQPDGSRIQTVRMSGNKTLDDKATYTVVMNDFLATGGDQSALSKKALTMEPLNISDLDALIGFIRAWPRPIEAPVGLRLVAMPRR